MNLREIGKADEISRFCRKTGKDKIRDNIREIEIPIIVLGLETIIKKILENRVGELEIMRKLKSRPRHH